MLVSKCEFLFGQEEQDLSMASFADDVSRVSLGHSTADLQASMEVVNTSLDRRLWEIELVQNRDKQEHVVYFGGPRSKSYYRQFYSRERLPGKTLPSARYLGGRVHFAGQSHEEIAMRVQAAKVNWARMGQFWFRSVASRRSKLLVYRALVHSTLLSGLEVLVLEKGKFAQLDSLILQHGRKLMQGKACDKQEQEDGTIRYVSCKSKVVWRWMGLCPCELELQIRRLSWYQQLARDVQRHKCVLMALFGRLGCESEEAFDLRGGLVETANPWAKQFADDMRTLEAIDDGHSLLQLVSDNFGLVFTEYASDFISVDVSALRRLFDPVCIPPPGWLPPEEDGALQDAAEAEGEVERPFTCECLLHDGSSCGQKFPTQKALAVHKSSTKGGTHDRVSDMATVAITNACPWCKGVFSSTQSARNHIRRTLKEGKCSGLGSSVYFQIQTPSNMQCRVCHTQFSDTQELLDHVVSHVRLQRPEAQA